MRGRQNSVEGIEISARKGAERGLGGCLVAKARIKGGSKDADGQIRFLGSGGSGLKPEQFLTRE